MRTPIRDALGIDYSMSNLVDTGNLDFAFEERDLSPFAHVRVFQDEIIDGNLSDEMRTNALRLEWDDGMGVNPFGSGEILRLELGFHESKIDNTFEFRPRGSDKAPPALGNSKQGSDPSELGGDVGEFAMMMEQAFGDPMWEFAELDAASVASGGFTDYEFKYEGQLETTEIVEANIDKEIR